jgi:hypothetical protein
MNPGGKALPGKNQADSPLANEEICLKFSFKTGVGTTGVVEYVETHQVLTDPYGMVNLTLGLGAPQVEGAFASFDLIPWISGTKFLKVELDKTCIGVFTQLGLEQPFTAVPFALYAVNSPPGPQGPQGPAGAAGSTGPAGPAGINGAAASALDFVDLSTNQTVGGVKTFTSPIAGSVTGNAATVTTNANLTGPVTSVGNNTSIANGAITNAMLANTAVANLTGTNTGDQTAATVSSVPAGSISATNVQAALNELDSEKAPLASPTFIGTPSLPTGTIAITQAPANNSTALATTAYVDNAASTAVTAASTAILGGTGILPVIKGGTGASTLTGLVKGNGTSPLTAAVPGTDYLAPNGSAADLTNFPTLNQSTTGNAATATSASNFTGNLLGDVTGTQAATVVGKINGTSLATLNTGLLKNTTATGVPSIAIAGTDYIEPSGTFFIGTTSIPLNRASAPQILTDLSIDGTAENVTGTVAVANGGTGLTAAGTKGQVLTSTGTGTDLAWSLTYSEGYHAELGGYVFYVTPDGSHGLVAATQLQCTNCTWFEAQNVVSNQANFTDPLVRKFTDWRLPTQHELGLMHQKFLDNSIPGFNSGFSTAGWYWSSTIIGYGETHARQFGSTNNAGNRDWDNQSSTRAVRSF